MQGILGLKYKFNKLNKKQFREYDFLIKLKN